MKTAEELKTRRLSLGFSQSEMARALGVSVRTYQGWEYDRPIPAFLSLAIDAIECRMAGDCENLNKQAKPGSGKRKDAGRKKEGEE